MLIDLRFAFRQLLKHPGFTAVVLVTLALCIGLNTAIFSIVSTMLYSPLPFPEPERLLRVWRTSPNSQRWPHALGDFLDFREQNSVFEHVAAFKWEAQSLSEKDTLPEALEGMRVSANFFSTLGVTPLLGRTFLTDEDQPGKNQVVVLGEEVWLRRFGGDTNILGRTIVLESQPVTVVGVMSKRLTHFRLWGQIDVWKPMTIEPEQRENRDSRSLNVVARLKPGVSPAQAEANLRTLAAQIAQEHPTSFNVKESVRLETLQESLLSSTVDSGRCYMMLAIACFVLLIGCVNVANLQLARATQRTREMAVRIALGAGRGRLLRQLLTESLLLALLGSGCGLILALWGNDLLAGYINQHTTAAGLDKAITSFPVDGRVLSYTVIVSLLTGILFGIVPAIHASRPDINRALKDGGTTVSAGRSPRRLQGWLIIGQVAITLVLLVGCGLFGQSLIHVLRMDPGYRMERRLALVLHLSKRKYTENTQIKNLYREVIERLGAIPGVKRVGATANLPVWRPGNSRFFDIQGQPTADLQSRLVHTGVVTPGLFATLGMPLKEGRDFTERDDSAYQAPPVVIINQALAQKYFPGRSPIGERIGSSGSTNLKEIVGVVGDVKACGESRSHQAVPEWYQPLGQSPMLSGWVVLETSVEPESLSEAVRRTVASIDPELPVVRLASLERILGSEVFAFRIIVWLLGGFSVLGLLLAAVGVYGVISFNVARRTHDIGLRMALGAQRIQVLGLLMRQGLVQVGLGLGLGLLGAVVLTQTMRRVLEDIEVWDPPTLLTAMAVLIATATLACYLPARRATRVDPIMALRYE
jgi:putative ABC transport system permease protein